MIVITGATGHLGRLVIEHLLQRVPPNEIIAAVRNLDKASDLVAHGIEVRYADYDNPDSLLTAFDGAEKILLISASEVGKRLAQHRNALAAIQASNAQLLVYTSLLKADTSGISLAKEHLPTEELVRGSGIPYVILRNSWYIENYTRNLEPALQHGALAGSAGDGRISAATRADYAEAAAVVLTEPGHEGKIYELAGDQAFTMKDVAAEVSRATGKTIVYNDLPPDQYRAMLLGAGLRDAIATMLADADEGIRRGDLESDSSDLRTLIKRPTTTLQEAVRTAVADR
jgi:NAD(P)H dehydrogenase (quinone)